MSNIKGKKNHRNSTAGDNRKDRKSSNLPQRTSTASRKSSDGKISVEKSKEGKPAVKQIASRPKKTSPSPAKPPAPKPEVKPEKRKPESPKKPVEPKTSIEKKNSELSEPLNTSENIKSLSKDETPSDGRRLKPKEEGPIPEL